MTPKIAILLAAYNGINWIDEQIQSIFDQVDVDIDIYLSVDVSTDGTERYCISLANEYKNVFMLPYGERFGGAAKNFYHLIKLIDFNNYNYVSFSDQDDVWNKDKLINAIKKINSQDSDGYSSDVLAFWKDGHTSVIKKSQPQVKYDHFFESAGPGCSIVITQKLAMEFQHFLISHPDATNIEYHDWFLYAFSRSFGYRWIIDDYVSMKYRQHENNQIGANHSWGAAVKRISMVRNGWYRGQINAIVEILEQKKIPFIKNCFSRGYLGNIYLAFNVHKTRRKIKDRIVLFVMALLYLI